MNTLKKWLAHRYAKRAKIAIVAYAVGLFTRDFVVNYIIGAKAFNALFVNGKDLAIVIAIVVIVAFLVYKPAFKQGNNQNAGFAPRS